MTGVALYQLAAEYQSAAARLADLDLPPDALRDTLDGLTGELEAKAMNVGFFLKGLEATIAAMKDAEDQLKARRKAAENRLAHVRDYLLGAMQATGIKKIEGPMLRLTVRDNPEALDVFDERQIPAEYFTTPEPPPPPPPKLDTARLKDDLKAGVIVPGARLTRGQRLEIKN